MEKKFAELFVAVKLWKKKHWGPLDSPLSKESLVKISVNRELSLNYNEANSYLLVNCTEIIKFKAKNSEIVAYPLLLRNISKDFSVDSMKKTVLNGHVYIFSVDYKAIAGAYVLDIHNYLMKKNEIV